MAGVHDSISAEKVQNWVMIESWCERLSTVTSYPTTRSMHPGRQKHWGWQILLPYKQVYFVENQLNVVNPNRMITSVETQVVRIHSLPPPCCGVRRLTLNSWEVPLNGLRLAKFNGVDIGGVLQMCRGSSSRSCYTNIHLLTSVVYCASSIHVMLSF